MIVNAGPQAFVLLFNKEELRSDRRGGWSNYPTGEGVKYIISTRFSLRAREIAVQLIKSSVVKCNLLLQKL